MAGSHLRMIADMPTKLEKAQAVAKIADMLEEIKKIALEYDISVELVSITSNQDEDDWKNSYKWNNSGCSWE